MKKILVISLIALLAPALVFAAQPAATAGAKSGSTVTGGLSAGTIAAGTLAVAIVGSLVLSNGGDGGGTSGGVVLPPAVDNSIDSFTSSLTNQQVDSFNYIMVKAADTPAVANLLDAVAVALATPGVTAADVQNALSAVNSAKDRNTVLSGVVTSAYTLRSQLPELFAVTNEFIQSLNLSQVSQLGQTLQAISQYSSYLNVSTVIQQETTVVVVTPVHTPSTHFTTPTHQF